MIRRVLAGLLLVSLAMLTHQRARVWHDGLSLWTQTVRESPHSPRVHNNLGKEYVARSLYQNGLLEFQREIAEAEDPRRSPYQRGFSTVLANANIAVILLRIGDLPRAERILNALLIMAPEFAPTHYNYAALLAMKGDCATARTHYALAQHFDRWITPPMMLPCAP